jgi:hypothetical protein
MAMTTVIGSVDRRKAGEGRPDDIKRMNDRYCLACFPLVDAT